MNTSNPNSSRVRYPRSHRYCLKFIWAGVVLATTIGRAPAGCYEHYWSPMGYSNWNNGRNWSPPGFQMNGTDCLIFPEGGTAYPTNVNDIVYDPPTNTTPFMLESLSIKDGGYDLSGNPVSVTTVNASYRAGSNSVIRFDLHSRTGAVTAPLQVNVQTNNSTLTLTGDLYLKGTGVTFGGAGDCVVSGVIQGTGSLVKSNGNYGEVRLAGFGPNTYTGETTVNAGLLRLSRYRLSGLSPVGTTAVTGDLDIGTGTNVGASVFVVLERNNQIVDTSKVTVHGSGQLDLNGHNNTISELTLRGGSVVTRTGMLTVTNKILAPSGAGLSVVDGNLHLDTKNPFSITVYAGRRLEIPAAVSGMVQIAKREGGELWLAGGNTFTGALEVWGGKLTVAHPEALGGGAPGPTNDTRFMENGTILELDHTVISNEALTVNANSTVSALGTCGWWGGVVLTNSADLTVNTASGATLTLGGAVSGGHGFTKTGTGTLRLAGNSANVFNYTLEVDNGTLELAKTAGVNAVPGDLTIGDFAGGSEADEVELSADEQINDASGVELTASGLLNLSSHAETIGKLTGSGAVSLGSGVLTVSNNVNHAYSGDIRGGRSGFAGADVTKDGPGTWTLSGINTYWGKTLVKGGTLLVNGTIENSDIEISPGAMLGGAGTVQGISFSGTGGTLAPGGSAGRLTAQGVVALTNGTFEVELNGLAPGTGYDQLVTEQAPILSGFLRQSCNLSVIAGFTPPVGSSFVIISNRSESAVSGTFAGKTEGAKFAANGALFQITYNRGSANDVVLTRVATPPASNFVASASSGQMEVRARGYAGVSYVLEAAPYLDPPIPWTPIGTNVANGSGLVQFADVAMPDHAQRFYRVASR